MIKFSQIVKEYYNLIFLYYLYFSTDFDIVDEIDNHLDIEYNLKYPGFTYLHVTGSTNQLLSGGSGQYTSAPTGGTLYTRVGPATSGFT